MLLDCGIYCASWLDDFLPAGEAQVTAFAGVANDQGIDMYASATLEVAGLSATLECAFDRAKPRQAVLVGTRGRVVIEELHRCQRATVYADGCEPRVIDAPYEVDDFYGEALHFTKLVAAGAEESDVMPLQATVRCVRIVDAVKARFSLGRDALRALEVQEGALRWHGEFTSSDALELGNAVARLSREYDRGVTVRVVREPDGLAMFEWAADDKAPRNQEFAQGKRRASLACGHSSLWADVAHEVDGSFQDLVDRSTPDKFGTPEFACPVDGAFPIRDERGALLATLCVSGLHEGLDHELAVRALAEAEGKECGWDVPVYAWLAR